MTLNDIIAALRGADKQAKGKAAEQAMLLGAKAAPAAVELAAHAGDSDIGEPCVAALEELGPPPVEAIDALTRLLDKDEMPAYWAATLLGRLGEQAAPASGELANTADSSAPLAVRERAIWALGKIGPAADEAMPVLEKLSAANQPRLARLAQQAMGTVNP